MEDKICCENGVCTLNKRDIQEDNSDSFFTDINDEYDD